MSHPTTTTIAPATAAPAAPTRGFWISLFSIGLVVSIVRNLLSLATETLPLVSSEAWAEMTTPGHANHHPLLTPVVVFEIVAAVALAVFAFVVLAKIGLRRRSAPAYAVTMLIASLGANVIDTLLAGMVPALAVQQGQAWLMVGATAVVAAPWVVYFSISRRVKAYFTN